MPISRTVSPAVSVPAVRDRQPSVDFSPTVDDVAAIIRARTKDSNGNEVGTFTDATRPTNSQAQEAINHQVVLVHQKVGRVGTACADLARMAAAIGAAAEIELSYFPEQARTDRSPYTYLIARYDEALAGVLSCVLGDLPDCTSDLPGGTVPGGLGFGTLDVISDTVWAYYTGNMWPPLPVVPIPDPTPTPPTPPVNTSLPAISGTAVVGQTLSVSDGGWDGDTDSFMYQWFHGDATSNSSIVGATANTYLLVNTDTGETIFCMVTAYNDGGSGSASSAPTDVVQRPAPVMNPYLTAMLAKTPLALYPVNEPNAAVGLTDISGNHHDGTYLSGALTFGQPSILPSGDDQCVLFTTSGSGAAAAESLTTGDAFTIAGWVRLDTSGTIALICGLGSQAPVMRVDSNDNLQLLASNKMNLSHSPIVLDDQPHFVVVTKDAAEMHCYVDNTESTLIDGNSVIADGTSVSIGGFDAGTPQGFPGVIYGVGIYAGAWTPQDVADIWAASHQAA
jgi:Concanavalin A-like lectin/glucanases superfamily